MFSGPPSRKYPSSSVRPSAVDSAASRASSSRHSPGNSASAIPRARATSASRSQPYAHQS